MAIAKKPEVKKKENKISQVIKKGATAPASSNGDDHEDPTKTSNVNIFLTRGEIARVKILREFFAPPARGKKRLQKSLQDWIIEAVEEKLKRDEQRMAEARDTRTDIDEALEQ